MIEKCPTFLMRGSKIVETYFTDWVSEDGKYWDLQESVVLDIDFAGDNLILETPVGCFEVRIGPTEPGETLTLEPTRGAGYDPIPCESPRETDEMPALVHSAPRAV